MTTTSWLIGSYPDLSLQTISVTDESATSEDVTIAAGDYYAYDATASRSLLRQLRDAINSHSNISDANTGVTKSGKFRVWRTGGSNFGITWGTSGETAKTQLGWTTNPSGANTYTADKVSPLFWSAGRKEGTRQAPIGISGQKLRDTVVGQAGTGVFRATQQNSYRVNTYFWRYIAQSRIWTTAEDNGEWYTFFDQVVARARQFNLWRNVDEDTSDETTIEALTTKLGPYKVTGDIEKWDYRREIANVDKLSPVEIDVSIVPEFGS